MVLRLFFSCAFCWVTSTCAAEVTLPEEQIDRLLQGNFIGCVKVPGWLLGIDGAKILNTSAGAEVSAESRAKAFATERLLSYSMRDALWQSELGGEVIAGISNSFLRSYQFKVRFQGLQPVKVWKGGGSSIRVIVGLPEPEKQIPAVSLEEVKAELRSALTSHPEKIDLAAYLEFCDQSDIPKVVDLLGERMGRYGKGAGATFAGRRLQSPADFHRPSTKGSENRVATNRTEWLELLGLHPYDPAVCLELGDLMQKSGYPRSAQLLFSRGASVYVGRDEAAACQRKADQSLWPLSSRSEISPDLILKLWKVAGVGMEEIRPVCRLIVESAGRLPVQAAAANNINYEEAWRQYTAITPDLTNALHFAMESLEEAFTADAANLVGKIFMLKNKNGAAIPFLEQARALDAEHAYATGNLAFALDGVGEKRLAETMARHAFNSPKTPIAFKEKLAELRNR